MPVNVLVVDDEDLFREDIATLLRLEGYECLTAANGEAAVKAAQAQQPDVVLCDLLMPGISGIETMKRILRFSPDTRVIILTAHAAIESAVEAFRFGAVDYVVKPALPEDLIRKINRCAEESRIQQELMYLRREMSEATTGTTIIGESPLVEAVRIMIARVGKSRSHVLITGESGTGKELVARALHETHCGPRTPFIAVNCAALPRDLLESELFGYVRGAFTNAVRDKPGLFELASGGTLFLDELFEMPLDLQPKLLRAIEQQEIVRLGAVRPTRVNVRIVAATNREVKREVDEGRFREDLYFRLAVVQIPLPPLRNRREDIPMLVEHLLRRLNRKLGRNVANVSAPAMRLLMSAQWRGNVRDMENVLERGILLTDERTIDVAHLPPELTGETVLHAGSDDLRKSVRAYEREHIRQVLDACRGNREEGARRLGVDSSTLYRRIKELTI